MIKISKLSKSFGSRNLLESVDLNVNKNEKIGLIGRNGHGKSTLFKIIMGLDHLDDGEIEIPKNYKIGYVEQAIKFKKNTVLNEVASKLPENEKDEIWQCEKILTGLGFSDEDMVKSPDVFSGGFQVRINLAKVLVSNCDLLLLDEPTNYLDIVSIRWLITFLKSWMGELILITHDRNVMDSIINTVAVIHRNKIRKISGQTEKAYEQIAKEEEIYEKTRVNDERRKKEIEIYINRFRAKANLAKMVQSRIKMLNKMHNYEKLTEVENLEFEFKYKDIPAKTLLNAENISFGYDEDNILIKDFSISIGKEDRIGIIGKNGKGKTTLLNLLSGKFNPKNGIINIHNKCETGIFSQTNVETLEKNNTVLAELESEIEYADRQLARNVCGSMMFSGDDALKKISILSGGEKARVMLGKLILSEKNLLFLDEPTNHLDIDSCDSLLEAIDAFKGAVLLVTHNEMFLNAIANRLVIFLQNEIVVFNGTYSEFLEKIGWEENDINNGNKENKNKSNPNKKELRKLKAELNKEKIEVLNPLKTQIEQNEKLLIEKEYELNKNNEELIIASENKDGQKINELSKINHDLENSINDLYDELEKVEKIYKIKEEHYLNGIDELS